VGEEEILFSDFFPSAEKDAPKVNWKVWYEGRLTRILPLLWLSMLIVVPILTYTEHKFYDVNSILISMSGLGSINGNQILNSNHFSPAYTSNTISVS
jgi:peptidoglycan/LPS O-acetylase OafA/YrhL